MCFMIQLQQGVTLNVSYITITGHYIQSVLCYNNNKAPHLMFFMLQQQYDTMYNALCYNRSRALHAMHPKLQKQGMIFNVPYVTNAIKSTANMSHHAI